MRKITKQAVNAFMNAENFKGSNTIVKVEKGISYLFLHGNMIAKRSADGRLEITNAGWQTNTTKERLNGLPNVSINQKNSRWYLNGEEWDGELTTIN